MIAFGHHKCYGSTTVGERGQIVIPAEAREELGISPGDKLIVFCGLRNGGLMLMKAELVTNLVTKAMEGLEKIEQEITRESDVVEK
jgi:AbrB family looped-hinge helix DNA binding protein